MRAVIGSDCARTMREVASYSFVCARLSSTAAAVTIPVSKRISGIRRLTAFRYAPRSCSEGAFCCGSSAAIWPGGSLGTIPEAARSRIPALSADFLDLAADHGEGDREIGGESGRQRGGESSKGRRIVQCRGHPARGAERRDGTDGGWSDSREL